MADKDIILAIDIGNTNITMSTHDGKVWGDELRVKTRSKKAVSDVSTILKGIKCDRSEERRVGKEC